MRRDRVLFTGYLPHPLLRYLFPCCDVGLFPSIVAEAGPLVFLEAMASGCFPLGICHAGMAASIDSVAAALPAGEVDLMKLRRDPVAAIDDMVTGIGGALDLRGRHRAALRQVAIRDYDWSNVAMRLARRLDSL